MLSITPNAQLAHQMSIHTETVERAMERISGGTKLNHAWEDPAGFAVAEVVRVQASASQELKGIIQDGINILNIGQDAIRGIQDLLQELRETVVQAANGLYKPGELAAFQSELDTQKGLLIQAFTAAKNFRVRLDGGAADRVLHFPIGPNAGEVVTVDYNPLRDVLRDLILGAFGWEELYNNPDTREFLAGQGIYPTPAPTDIVPPPPLGPAVPPGTTWAELFPKKLVVDPNTKENIDAAFALLDTAQAGLIGQETHLGSVATRMANHLEIVENFEQNLAERQSRLRDTDMAAESTAMTRAQVLQQASQAMIAQANSRALEVVELLRR